VSSFQRQLITRHCPHFLLCAAAIDRHLLPAGPTAANAPLRTPAVFIIIIIIIIIDMFPREFKNYYYYAAFNARCVGHKDDESLTQR